MSKKVRSAALLLGLLLCTSVAKAQADPWQDYDAAAACPQSTEEQVSAWGDLPQLACPVQRVSGRTGRGAALAQPTVTGMPYASSNWAPASLALQNQGRASLPRTVIDSFILASGKNDLIYGQEGMVKDLQSASIESGFDQISRSGLSNGPHQVRPELADLTQVMNHHCPSYHDNAPGLAEVK